MVAVFVNDIGAVAAETTSASASRCRAVLAAIERLRTWLDERETQWLNRLADHDPAYDWAEEAIQEEATAAGATAAGATAAEAIEAAAEADFPLAG